MNIRHAFKSLLAAAALSLGLAGGASAATLSFNGISLDTPFERTFDYTDPSGDLFITVSAPQGHIDTLSLLDSNYDELVLVRGGPTVNQLSLSTHGLLMSTTYVLSITGGGAASSLLSTTPVPEPETVALAVGGLVVVGVVARRRRQA